MERIEVNVLTGERKVTPLAASEIAAINSLENKRPLMLRRVNEIKQAKLTGTIVVSGMTISLDADSKGLMALGKTNGARATRKIHTHAGDRSILTAAQFDALVAAIENFGQLAMDRAYDLSVQIDAATTVAELDAIDVNAGWPT